LFSDTGARISSLENSVVSLYGVPFDVVGFCFARGIAKRSRSSVEYTTSEEQIMHPGTPQEILPSPLVGDCLIEECNLPYAHSFLRRVREAGAVKNTRPPIPF